MFLTEKEIDDLTGIKRGQDGMTKHETQVAWLRNHGFPVIENARGRPILARSVFDSKANRETEAWKPAVC